MLKITRAVSLIIENEPSVQFGATDDIDFNSLSNRTLSLLHEFMFSATNVLSKKVDVKKAEQSIQQANVLGAFTANSVKKVNTFNMYDVVTAFIQHMNLNDIGMPTILDQATSSHSQSHETVAVHNRNAQPANTFDMDDLIRLFGRNWFGASMNLQYINDVMISFNFDENDFIQIDFTTIDGQPKLSLLVSRDVLMQLVHLVFDIIYGDDTAATTTSNIERATITEIIETNDDGIGGVIDLTSEDSDSIYARSSDDSHYTNSTEQSECTSDDSIERPISPNSLDAALFALYNNVEADKD